MNKIANMKKNFTPSEISVAEWEITSHSSSAQCVVHIHPAYNMLYVAYGMMSQGWHSNR